MVAKSSQTKDGCLRGQLHGCSEPSLWRLHSPVSTQVCISPGSLGGEASAIALRGAQDPDNRVPQSMSAPEEQALEYVEEDLPRRAIGEQPHEGRITGEDLRGASQEKVSREDTLGDACNEHHEGGPPQRAPWGRTSIEHHERETPGEHYPGKTSREHHGREVPDKERVV